MTASGSAGEPPRTQLADTAVAGGNRRTAVRIARDDALFVRILATDSGGSNGMLLARGTARDASASGIGVCVEREVVEGSPVELWVDLHGDRKYFLAGAVAWCRETEGDDGPEAGRFRVGIELREAKGTDLAEWQLLMSTADDAEDVFRALAGAFGHG